MSYPTPSASKISSVILFWLIVSAIAAWGKTPVPALTGRVVDQANLLVATEHTQLTKVIQAFETSTGGQFAVLIVPRLENDSIESFSIRVADKWKIGDKERDDGLILVISVEDRQTRLEVGQGFEGLITDARAGDILRAMVPYFREQRFVDGLILAVDMSARFITGSGLDGVDVRQSQEQITAPVSFSSIIVLLIFLFLTIHLMTSGGFVMTSGGYRRSGGFGGGYSGFSRGGGFSGAGGGFSGGGASGRW